MGLSRDRDFQSQRFRIQGFRRQGFRKQGFRRQGFRTQGFRSWGFRKWADSGPPQFRHPLGPSDDTLRSRKTNLSCLFSQSLPSVRYASKSSFEVIQEDCLLLVIFGLLLVCGMSWPSLVCLWFFLSFVVVAFMLGNTVFFQTPKMHGLRRFEGNLNLKCLFRGFFAKISRK